MRTVELNNRERDALILTIDRLKAEAIHFGMAPAGSSEELLAMKKGRLHYDRMLDTLYPGTAPLVAVVPIESLAPSSLGEARDSDNLPRAEGYGPPPGVELFVLSEPDSILEVHDFFKEMFGE